MSNDHIFAAQMWSWADPMIKRDSHGRILVVNAAFLQLYGGTIETWTGNPIEGWPAPKSPGEMSRFESRIPMPTGGETVYDWMECTHQDGTALAMARDVTVYAMAQKAPQAPVTPVAEPVMETPVQQPVADAADKQAVHDDLAALSPITKITQDAQQTPQANSAPAPVEPAPAQIAEPVAEMPPATPAVAAAVAATAATAAAIAQPVAAAEPAPVAPEAPATPEPVQAIADTAPAQVDISPAQVDNAPAQEERAYEKRALPIENDDAILGNNWRDAVIAKAVGVEDDTAATSDSQTTAPAPAKNASGNQIRVLLAEDNAINALLTRTLLEADGCSCDVVEDGALAVEAVKNNEYDLVFMDMRMPNMDGLEATRKIRSIGYNAKSLPIVALTANAFDDDRNACFDSGMNDFMTKPVSAEELSAMVKTHTSLEAEKIAS